MTPKIDNAAILVFQQFLINYLGSFYWIESLLEVTLLNV